MGPAACPAFPPRQARNRVLMGPAGSALRKEGVSLGEGGARRFPCPFSPSLTTDLRASQTGEILMGQDPTPGPPDPPGSAVARNPKENRLACPSMQWQAGSLRLMELRMRRRVLMAAAIPGQPPIPASQRRCTLGNVSTRSLGSGSSPSRSSSRPSSAPLMRAGGLTGRGPEVLGTFL